MRHPIARLTYGINETLCKRPTMRCLGELNAVQKYSVEKLRAYQDQKLRELLTHAYGHTARYRAALDKSGVIPAQASGIEDLRRLPFGTRADMRADTGAFISDRTVKGLARYATSGSTGEPLIFYLSNERISANKAAYLMLYGWWGLEIGDREAVLWGSSRDVSAYSIAKKIRDRFLNTRLLPAFHMGEQTMSRYADFIRSYKPKDIFGYAHSIYLLARFAKNRGISLKDAGVKVVFTTAEALHDFQRELISEIFNCPVSNCYGGRDSGLVTFECPAGGMHLNPNIITEIIKDGVPVMPGEKGEIVVTDLDSYGMPFIRYRTGDEGIMGTKPCPCGRPTAVMEKVIGRDTDYVVNAKGEFIHPLALEYVFREIEGIDYFKITQKKEDALVIDIVSDRVFDPAGQDAVRVKLCAAMGAAISISFNFIKAADIPAQDKYKFVVSDVIKNYL